MKTINLKGISNPLSEREMKNVVGGSAGNENLMGDRMVMPEDQDVLGSGGGSSCSSASWY
jgi:natural product precursor